MCNVCFWRCSLMIFVDQVSWCLRRQFLGVSSRTHSSRRGDWTCRPSTLTSTSSREYQGRTNTGKHFRTISVPWNCLSRSSSRWWFKTTLATRLLHRWMPIVEHHRSLTYYLIRRLFFLMLASDRLHHPSSTEQPAQSSIEHFPPQPKLHQHQPSPLCQQLSFPAISLWFSWPSDTILTIPVIPVLFHQQSQPPIPRVGARFEPDRGERRFCHCRNEARQWWISGGCNHPW